MADLFDEHVPIERPDIPELLNRLRRFGDTSAGEEVLNYYITCYGKRVFHYLHHLGLKDDVAEWICNETFMKFWQHEEVFEPCEGELSYLFNTALRSTQDYWRREKKFRAIPIDEGTLNIQDKGETPDIIVTNCEEEEKLKVAISRLSKKQRQVIRLQLEGKTQLEIAREIGVSKPSGVSYWLKKAKENLQRQLNNDLEGEIS